MRESEARAILLTRLGLEKEAEQEVELRGRTQTSNGTTWRYLVQGEEYAVVAKGGEIQVKKV